MSQRFGEIETNTQMDSSADTDSKMANTPRIYRNGVFMSNAKEYWSSAVVSGGVARFYLTDDHTANGTAIFANVYKESMSFEVEDNSNSYRYGSITIDANKKYVDVTVTKLSANSSNALITLIGGVAAFLTGLTFVSAANGITVYLKVKGN